MMRPDKLHKGGTLYWTIPVYGTDGALKDADSTPTVAVRKNGSSVADSVTVTKRAATTGLYDCSYDPSGEITGDKFTIEETVTITTAFFNSWTFAVVALPTEIAEAGRNAILNRELSGNHDTTGTVGKLLQALSGITSLLAILKKMIRADFTDETAETEIGGTYDDATDSLEAKGTVVAAIKAKTDTIAKGVYTVNSHFNPVTKALTLYQGDDYLEENGRQTDIELDELSDVDLDGATAAVGAKGKYDKSLTITGTASVVEVEGTPFLRLEFPRAKISGTPGCYEYDAEVYDATTGAVVTTVVGELTLKESKTPLVS